MLVHHSALSDFPVPSVALSTKRICSYQRCKSLKIEPEYFIAVDLKKKKLLSESGYKNYGWVFILNMINQGLDLKDYNEKCFYTIYVWHNSFTVVRKCVMTLHQWLHSYITFRWPTAVKHIHMRLSLNCVWLTSHPSV